ncbi:hypothetical protein [Fulvimarina sp. MAC3]|uniref:hypothetical protein n=1 Tax=Fulvimarina sp. MAC3 TaxID=3148887 RepID=UPI0031FCBDF3
MSGHGPSRQRDSASAAGLGSGFLFEIESLLPEQIALRARELTKIFHLALQDHIEGEASEVNTAVAEKTERCSVLSWNIQNQLVSNLAIGANELSQKIQRNRTGLFADRIFRILRGHSGPHVLRPEDQTQLVVRAWPNGASCAIFRQ